jgi:hypothetical protein
MGTPGAAMFRAKLLNRGQGAPAGVRLWETASSFRLDPKTLKQTLCSPLLHFCTQNVHKLGTLTTLVVTFPIKLSKVSQAIAALVGLAATAWAQTPGANNYPVGNFPKFIISADLRNNGEMDVVTANYHSGNITVLLGNGNGTFQTEVNYPVGEWPTGLAAGDFNGDGILDLAVANAWDPGSLSGPPCQQCAADGVSVLLGNGDGTFKPSVYYAAASGTAWVSAYDFNGDGKLDIVATAWFAGQVSILLGNGDGTFQPPLNFPAGIVPHSVAIGDFDGDGKADMAVGNLYSSDVSVLLGNGDGTFRSGVTLKVPSMPHSIAMGDFNHDGKLDLATANESGSVSILLGEGDGRFKAAVTYNSGTDTTSVVTEDFNGDGILDLAAANAGSTPTEGVSISLFLGNGDGTFKTPAHYYTGGPGSNAVVAAHFTNNDGFLDLAVAHFLSDVTMLYGNGTGTFSLSPP